MSRTETDWERRKRLAEVFGDPLPEITSDERDPGEQPADRDSAVRPVAEIAGAASPRVRRHLSTEPAVRAWRPTSRGSG